MTPTAANPPMREVDALVVGGSLAAAACAKRLVDAGLETVVIERKLLPRHKICSGILSPRGHRFLIENFGPLPREILHEPTSCRGVTFHFPSLLKLSMDFDRGPTPHLHRKYSDYWALQRSGAEIQDQTAFVSLKDEGGRVEVVAQTSPESANTPAETRLFRARFVIGADGPDSRVVRAIYPNYTKQIPWFLVGQKFHEIVDCPLDPDYFHFWFHPNLGHYTWSHARDGRQIVGVGFPKGGDFNRHHQNVVDYLANRHGVKLGPPLEPEGCVENFGPSLINRYIFGKGNVLITGQAAGFLNMMAEGMSVALHSGAIAGEAAVEALQRNKPVQEMYRTMIASEVRRCSDQWNPLRIAFARPHEADFRAALKILPWKHRLKMLAEVLNFIRIYSPFKWGRQILGQAIYRIFHPGYSAARWE